MNKPTQLTVNQLILLLNISNLDGKIDSGSRQKTWNTPVSHTPEIFAQDMDTLVAAGLLYNAEDKLKMNLTSAQVITPEGYNYIRQIRYLPQT